MEFVSWGTKGDELDSSNLGILANLCNVKPKKLSCIFIDNLEVRDGPKLLGDSGEVPIFEWSDWRFDSHCEICSLLDGKN